MGEEHDESFNASAPAQVKISNAWKHFDMKIYTVDELRAMDPVQLISHTARLQHLYKQVESDNHFLSWEFQEFQESFTYFSRAARLAHKLNASDMDDVADLATTELPDYFNCSFSVLFLYDDFTRDLTIFKSSDDSAVPKPFILNRDTDATHFLIKLFFTQQEPFIVEYVDSHNIVVGDNNERLTAVVPEQWVPLLGPKAMVLPLIVPANTGLEPNIIGGLIIGNALGQGKLEAKDAEIGILFSDLLSSSLYNARLVEKLNDLTVMDPLTGLYNRRHLINQLGAAMIQARRHGHDLSIAMLDIDHFKRVNDTYGHMVGDKVLRQLADMLRSSVRTDIDTPARYGGEEFIIIMPYINAAGAVTAAERLRARISGGPFNLDGLHIDITCSIGVAEYAVSECLERFIDRADVALYRAKKNGRNQVVAAVANDPE